MRDERGFFRTSDPGTFSFESLQRLHAEGRLYAPYGGEVVLDTVTRRAYCSNGGNIGVKYYLADLGDGRHAVERGVDNIWDDIPGLGTTPNEDLGYPTQKTEALLTRVLNTATQPGDWVLDPFMGSGTTLAVAQKLGRRWIGCDVGYGSVQTARRRLQAVIQAQLASEPPQYRPSIRLQNRLQLLDHPALPSMLFRFLLRPLRSKYTSRLPRSTANRLEYG